MEQKARHGGGILRETALNTNREERKETLCPEVTDVGKYYVTRLISHSD